MTPIIRINNNYSTIENLPYGASNLLWKNLVFEIPNAEQIAKNGYKKAKTDRQRNYWLNIYDGKKHLFTPNNTQNGGKFLSGLISNVIIEIKNGFGITPEIIDERIKPIKTLNLNWNEKVYQFEGEKTRPYQKEAVEKAIKRSRSILSLATGAGKSLIAARIIYELGVSPFIFYVLTIDLANQAKENFEKMMPGLKCGYIGNGECDIRDINIMTVQTAYLAYGNKSFLKDLKSFKDQEDVDIAQIKKEKLDHIKTKKKEIQNLIENAKGIFGDEIHNYASQTCETVITKSKNAYYRFGGSATIEREDNAELIIYGLFGRKSSEISASELIRMGYLMKPIIYCIKMKKQNHGIITNWHDDERKSIIENDERNKIIISCMETLNEEGRSVLGLVKKINHGKYLESQMLNCDFISGKDSSKKRTKFINEFKEGIRTIGIGSTIADEGLDIPVLSGLCICGGGKSKGKMMQRIGRAIRIHPNKPQPIIIYFIDNGKYTSEHSKEIIKLFKKEPEFDVRIVDSFSRPKQKENLLF